MLLRTVVLLLLCLPSGRCATLGHYQTQAKEEEAPAVDPVAVEAPEQETIAADGAVADAPVAVDLVADRPVADEPVNEIHEAESKTQIVEAPVSDPPTAEENVADTIAADELATEIRAADNLVAEELEVDGPIADEPETEALAQDASDEEEGNDSRAVQADQSLGRPLTQETDSSWSLSSVRDSFQTINGYFDSLVELVGGRNGVCEYHCRYGKTPQPRPGYQMPEPNGCSSLLMGFQFDLGIPAMTKCCDQLDVCYDACGVSKYHCDGNFRRCLHDICSDLKKSLGFVSKVEACESVADSLYNTVWTLGCRPYMNSQRAACLCEEEERDEL